MSSSPPSSRNNMASSQELPAASSPTSSRRPNTSSLSFDSTDVTGNPYTVLLAPSIKTMIDLLNTAICPPRVRIHPELNGLISPAEDAALASTTHKLRDAAQSALVVVDLYLEDGGHPVDVDEQLSDDLRSAGEYMKTLLDEDQTILEVILRMGEDIVASRHPSPDDELEVLVEAAISHVGHCIIELCRRWSILRQIGRHISQSLLECAQLLEQSQATSTTNDVLHLNMTCLRQLLWFMGQGFSTILSWFSLLPPE